MWASGTCCKAICLFQLFLFNVVELYKGAYNKIACEIKLLKIQILFKSSKFQIKHVYIVSCEMESYYIITFSNICFPEGGGAGLNKSNFRSLIMEFSFNLQANLFLRCHCQHKPPHENDSLWFILCVLI